jgi:hypothetical protein
LSARRLALCIALSTGCGNLVDGEYLGDAVIRLAAIVQGDVAPARSPVVGVAWLGYAGLADPLDGLQTTELPITSILFPSSFSFDVVGAPPDVGRYITADDSRIIPATMRVGRLIVLDDVDRDGRFTVDAAGVVVAPDRLIAVAARQALMYVDDPPPDPGALTAAHAFLRDWTPAARGYHLLQLDGDAAMPDVTAQVIAPSTQVIFTPPAMTVSW